MLRIDDLQYKGLKLYQDTDGFCFGTDAVLLAAFARIEKGSALRIYARETALSRCLQRRAAPLRTALPRSFSRRRLSCAAKMLSSIP